MQVAILNTSIVTAYGAFAYEPISLDQAKKIIANAEDGVLSAVGHQATANILTDLLGTPVPMNRIEFAQQEGQSAIVFKLNGRAPEGVILSREEIEDMGYSFGLLTRHPAPKETPQDVKPSLGFSKGFF